MNSIEKSIVVDVPVSTAYNQWTQFESYPQFMEGVESVQQGRRVAGVRVRQGAVGRALLLHCHRRRRMEFCTIDFTRDRVAPEVVHLEIVRRRRPDHTRA